MPANFNDICLRVQKAASPSQNGNRLYLGLEHLASGHPALVGCGTESDVRSSKAEFQKGDVLFGKLRPYLRKSVLANADGICSTDILVFRAKANCDPAYLCFLTHTDEFVGHAKTTTSGVQHPRTSFAALREFKLHIPPLPEQRKIAGVLNLVQRAMEQQERLRARTAELKKALLYQLFTQGLRGEPQKQTDIGLVPESWEIVALQDVCTFLSGGTPSKQKPEFWQGRIPWVSPKDMKKPRLADVVDHISEAALDDGSALAPAGSVFVVIRGMILAKDVPVALAEVPMAFNQDMKAIIPGARIAPSFLLYALAAFKQNLFQKVGRSAHGTMTLMSSELAKFLIPLPDKRTQEAIAAAVEMVERKHGQHYRKHAALAALFRTLLHQLMTAQIRVHDLPDLVPQQLETMT